MYKKLKVIREELKQVIVQHKDDDGNTNAVTNSKSKIKDPGFEYKDKKRLQTVVAGKQKEPNRGEGTSRRPNVPHAHVTRPRMNEKAESSRHHPTHKIVSSTGNEVKYGSSIKASDGTSHIVDKLEPSRFGGAADRVRTHSAEDPSLSGSFHPKDIGVTMVKRTVKEERQKGWTCSAGYCGGNLFDRIRERDEHGNLTNNYSKVCRNCATKHPYTPRWTRAKEKSKMRQKGLEDFMKKMKMSEGRESETAANKMLAQTVRKKIGTEKEHKNAYFNWANKQTEKKKKPVKEDIGMAAGAAGDPGAVQNPNSNYAAQKKRGVKVKSLMRRKKPQC